jgi:epoxyqueuosine reductase QueG
MNNHTDISAWRRNLTPCCEIASASIESYPEEGRAKIAEFMSSARTVVVLGHHVKASLEWLWFPFESERGENTCTADLHAKAVVENTGRILESRGWRVLILPYPDACGISFKQLATRTSMGTMGDSFLFLHREWGPWVHLRILFTHATILDTRA